MKKELTSIEIKYLVEELQQLNGSRIEKIYQPEKKELLIVFHTKQGKKILRAILPSFLWITETKPEMPARTRAFCAALRKKLERSIVREIKQIESERIIEFEFETKEGRYSLILELFSKGNAILCKDKQIIMPLEVQEWKDRTVKKAEKYELPAGGHNIFELSLDEFKEIIEKSKDTISKTLAVKIRTGGIYAEETCLRAGIDKKRKKTDQAETKKLYKTLQELLKQKKEPNIVLKDDKIIDIVPIKLEIYAEYRQKEFNTYSQALDTVLSKGVEKEKITEVEQKFQAKLDKINKKIQMQEKNLAETQIKAAEAQKKGEKIYEQYQELKKLLEKIKELRKEQGWKEIKERLKKRKAIKSVDEKTGKIVLDI